MRQDPNLGTGSQSEAARLVGSKDYIFWPSWALECQSMSEVSRSTLHRSCKFDLLAPKSEHHIATSRDLLRKPAVSLKVENQMRVVAALGCVE
eukprot:scaffold327482_cov14-Prasinocladus_malaysianus.AAC.2